MSEKRKKIVTFWNISWKISLKHCLFFVLWPLSASLCPSSPPPFAPLLFFCACPSSSIAEGIWHQYKASRSSDDSCLTPRQPERGLAKGGKLERGRGGGRGENRMDFWKATNWAAWKSMSLVPVLTSVSLGEGEAALGHRSAGWETWEQGLNRRVNKD